MSELGKERSFTVSEEVFEAALISSGLKPPTPKKEYEPMTDASTRRTELRNALQTLVDDAQHFRKTEAVGRIESLFAEIERENTVLRKYRKIGDPLHFELPPDKP